MKGPFNCFYVLVVFSGLSVGAFTPAPRKVCCCANSVPFGGAKLGS